LHVVALAAQPHNRLPTMFKHIPFHTHDATGLLSIDVAADLARTRAVRLFTTVTGLPLSVAVRIERAVYRAVGRESTGGRERGTGENTPRELFGTERLPAKYTATITRLSFGLKVHLLFL
jgi:hypothetical protein